jgi:crotonobetainyl-CoA:carnitine CoA-transferase CaiB-like acyl-CoA transferase
VVIENFRPGTLERLGFSWERIHELNPRAILCTISGYGTIPAEAGAARGQAPRADERARPSYDAIVQGESGIMDITGFPEGPPTRVGVSIADLVAGMHAVEGILLALYDRERTGVGEHVDIALFDGVLSLFTYQAQMALGAGCAPTRLGNAHPSIVPYQAFATREGYVSVAVGTDAFFGAFCEALGRPDLACDERFRTNRDRVEHRAELVGLLEEVFLGRTAAEWSDLLRAAGVPAGVVRSVPEALEAARAGARGMVVEIACPGGGSLEMVGNPVKLASIGMMPGYLPPPALGEHTDAVLADLGYGAAAIAALRAGGVV